MTEFIPELQDTDRKLIQTWGEFYESIQNAMEVLIEALKPIMEIFIALTKKLYEIFQRWQVWLFLNYIHFPKADWVSQHWPTKFLPPLFPRLCFRVLAK